MQPTDTQRLIWTPAPSVPREQLSKAARGALTWLDGHVGSLPPLTEVMRTLGERAERDTNVLRELFDAGYLLFRGETDGFQYAGLVWRPGEDPQALLAAMLDRSEKISPRSAPVGMVSPGAFDQICAAKGVISERARELVDFLKAHPGASTAQAAAGIKAGMPELIAILGELGRVGAVAVGDANERVSCSVDVVAKSLQDFVAGQGAPVTEGVSLMALVAIAKDQRHSVHARLAAAGSLGAMPAGRRETLLRVLERASQLGLKPAYVQTATLRMLDWPMTGTDELFVIWRAPDGVQGTLIGIKLEPATAEVPS